MLKYPVLIIESDDWGAGPAEQAKLLPRIAAVLASRADRTGRNPVMTLGLILGVADGVGTANGCGHDHSKALDVPEYAAIVAAIERGAELGVFALQLHGGEHYWPPALLTAARSNPQVAAWLHGPGALATESLPAPLQSRWIDSSELPSKALRADEIRTAALTEVARFRHIFGKQPIVAVPPTFIWNDTVEAAWAEAGVRFVVTPGRRYHARDADGAPVTAGQAIVNGDRGAAGIMYLVRDDYFEPARGHRAERGLAALVAKTRVGRPTLLETHRANFLGNAKAADTAIEELERLLTVALQALPDVQFLSTEELAVCMERRDPRVMEIRSMTRIHVWLRRLWAVSRLRKLACLTGAIIPAWLLYVASWRRAGTSYSRSR